LGADLCNNLVLSSNKIKQIAGKEAVKLVQPGMIVGLGTGSTAFYFIEALAARIKHGLECRAVPTSEQSRKLAKEMGIELVELNDVPAIDLTIDGADEIDPQLQLIKGGVGALLQEKMVAAASKQFVVIADESKLVKQLGAFPLPLEVIPYGWKQVQRRIQELHSIKTELRLKDDQPFITDHGHYILDCHFKQIGDPGMLNNTLYNIAGVVETGLFLNMADMAIIAYEDDSVRKIIR
jgi:ribose 5-phosphate isomerase A